MAQPGKPKDAGNSALQILSGVMSDLAAGSVLPDAQPHLNFFNSLMQEIQKYLHQPHVAGQALGGQGGPPGAPPGAGGPPGAPPGQPPMAPPQGMQNMGPPTPSVDELRRMLGVNAQAA